LPKEKVVILTTGSQGEPMSALTRIANDEHRQIKIIAGDTVIISATPIPGNERSVANTINALCVRGAKVIYGRDAGVHVSGHGCQEEQKLMINLCKPKFFMPVHGEYRMLVRHGELAVECGVSAENIFVMENGEVLELTADQGKTTGQVESGVLLIDFNRDFFIDEEIVAERQKLADDGLVVIAITVDPKGAVVGGPDVTLRGVILPRGIPVEDFVQELRQSIEGIIGKANAAGPVTPDEVRSLLIEKLEAHFARDLRSSPLLQVMVMRSAKASAEELAAINNVKAAKAAPKSVKDK
jgi:ribonuclease J